MRTSRTCFPEEPHPDSRSSIAAEPFRESDHHCQTVSYNEQEAISRRRAEYAAAQAAAADPKDPRLQQTTRSTPPPAPPEQDRAQRSPGAKLCTQRFQQRRADQQYRSARNAATMAPASRQPRLRTSRPRPRLPATTPPVRLGPPPPVKQAAAVGSPPGQGGRSAGPPRKHPHQAALPPSEPRFNPLPLVPGTPQLHAIIQRAAPPCALLGSFQQPLAEHQPWPGLAAGCDGVFAPAGLPPAAQMPAMPLCSPGAVIKRLCLR